MKIKRNKAKNKIKVKRFIHNGGAEKIQEKETTTITKRLATTEAQSPQRFKGKAMQGQKIIYHRGTESSEV